MLCFYYSSLRVLCVLRVKALRLARQQAPQARFARAAQRRIARDGHCGVNEQ